ncbi:hypothetical protein [Ruminococcus sp.]|uniref:hypothetical protein n=1 Tax=Ruminococcus sp. TaxID=41978 RepID=UPI0025E8AA6D|nr:hypothetical protein [Ruminococcus sp.]
MGSIWNDYKEDLISKEGLDAEAIFLAVMSETWKHDTTNAKLFTDLYNWYTCGIEDGMYQFFEFEYRTAESLKGLGSIIKKYMDESAFSIFQRCISQLMPLVNSDTPDSSAIDEISESMDAYFKENEFDLLNGIKKYLLAEGDKIAEEIGW